MNNIQLDNLKQFITVTVSQSEANTGKRIEAVEKEVRKTQKEVREMREEMKDGFTGVGDAILLLNDSADDHANRLVKLERQIT